MGKRVSKRKQACTDSLLDLLDQLEQVLPTLPDELTPRTDWCDLNRRLGQIRTSLSARAVRQLPTRRPRQLRTESLPLFC
jgi:hypothetical protein